MFVAILINIIIVLISIFIPALLKTIKLNKSERYFIENVSESTKGYLSIATPDVGGEKDIDKILNTTDIDDFSIDNFFDSLR